MLIALMNAWTAGEQPGVVEIEVVDAAGLLVRAQVTVDCDGARGGGSTDGAGVVHFDGVPPGGYMAAARWPEAPMTTTVRVPPRGTVTVRGRLAPEDGTRYTLPFGDGRPAMLEETSEFPTSVLWPERHLHPDGYRCAQGGTNIESFTPPPLRLGNAPAFDRTWGR